MNAILPLHMNFFSSLISQRAKNIYKEHSLFLSRDSYSCPLLHSLVFFPRSWRPASSSTSCPRKRSWWAPIVISLSNCSKRSRTANTFTCSWSPALGANSGLSLGENYAKTFVVETIFFLVILRCLWYENDNRAVTAERVLLR